MPNTRLLSAASRSSTDRSSARIRSNRSASSTPTTGSRYTAAPAYPAADAADVLPAIAPATSSSARLAVEQIHDTAIDQLVVAASRPARRNCRYE